MIFDLLNTTGRKVLARSCSHIYSEVGVGTFHTATILRHLALTPGVPNIHSLVAAVLLMDAMARTPIVCSTTIAPGLAQAISSADSQDSILAHLLLLALDPKTS